MPGPNWLTQAELDGIRAEQIDLIAEIGGTCTIKRPTNVQDGFGGYTQTFAVQNNVPCRHWISSGPNGTSAESRFWGEQELNQTDAFMVFYWNADIQVEDHITFDNRDWRVVGLSITDTFRTAIRARVVALR